MRPLTLILLASIPLRANDAVDRLALDALKAWQVPGVAIAIVHDDTTIVAAHGERTAGAPLETSDLFPLASCTKAFTTALIEQLAREGRMAFDDPVRRHLPEFHLADPKADALVTIRDLLAHRTGVNGHDLLWYRAPWKNAETLTRIDKLPLNDTFRGSYQYSTLMYMAAGQAAANAGGKPWEQLLREKLIEPLGMTSVRYTTRDPEFAKAAKAEGHRLVGG
jgi:CubicO group peptidase (beta-lactamase class C family)